jgi:hypothetical protein
VGARLFYCWYLFLPSLFLSNSFSLHTIGFTIGAWSDNKKRLTMLRLILKFYTVRGLKNRESWLYCIWNHSLLHVQFLVFSFRKDQAILVDRRRLESILSTKAWWTYVLFRITDEYIFFGKFVSVQLITFFSHYTFI